jgi:hypothetical protein
MKIGSPWKRMFFADFEIFLQEKLTCKKIKKLKQ